MTAWVLVPREPTDNMWDQAENASMFAEDAYAKNDPATVEDAHNFPTHRIWNGVVMYRAMISASQAPSDEVVDELCRAYSATSEIYGPAVEPWWEPDTKHMHRDKLRARDRTRMRAFLSKLQEPKP